MIVRIWNGWTTFENADAYEQLLKDEVLSRFNDVARHYEVKETIKYE